MASYTSYLNLEKPTTSETFNLLKINQNWDKIDAGFGTLNSNLSTMVRSKVQYDDRAAFTLNLASNERHMLVITATNSTTRTLILVVSTSSGGVINAAEIYKGSTVTYDVSATNKISVTQNTETRSMIVDFAISGEFVTIS